LGVPQSEQALVHKLVAFLVRLYLGHLHDAQHQVSKGESSGSAVNKTSSSLSRSLFALFWTTRHRIRFPRAEFGDPTPE
jgi:hypothetical protein